MDFFQHFVVTVEMQAVQDDSTLDNTPSHSMQSLTEEEKVSHIATSDTNI